MGIISDPLQRVNDKELESLRIETEQLERRAN